MRFLLLSGRPAKHWLLAAVPVHGEASQAWAGSSCPHGSCGIEQRTWVCLLLRPPLLGGSTMTPRGKTHLFGVRKKMAHPRKAAENVDTLEPKTNQDNWREGMQDVVHLMRTRTHTVTHC